MTGLLDVITALEDEIRGLIEEEFGPRRAKAPVRSPDALVVTNERQAGFEEAPVSV